MKIGVVIPTRVHHAMRELSWTGAREHSEAETDVIVLFNGCDPVALPEGVSTVHQVAPYHDEADLWWDALQLAERRGWDWCMMQHDDFRMMEPGWEAQLRESEGWRVAIAAHCVHAGWSNGSGCYPSWGRGKPEAYGDWPSRLGVTIDSMSFGFRVDVFRARGCVTEGRYGFGFGAWDACAWALMNEYGCWRIQQNAWHHWIENNARAILSIGAPGHQDVCARYGAQIFPSEITSDGTSIVRAGHQFRCAPEGWHA